MTAWAATRICRAGAAFLLLTAVTPQVFADCKCHRPEKGDKTRWGGNESVVIVPEHHFRELSGTVETFQDEKMEGALVEIFDKPDYLVNNKPWADKPKQILLKNCVTAADGKFCFRGLPSGTYELRVSKDQGWNVTHVYIVVDRKAAEKLEPLHITMHIGN